MNAMVSTLVLAVSAVLLGIVGFAVRVTTRGRLSDRERVENGQSLAGSIARMYITLQWILAGAFVVVLVAAVFLHFVHP